MVLITHIAVALISLAWTGYTFIAPSSAKLRGSYVLVAGTLVSGTFLVISSGSPLLKSCVTGLVYLGIVFAGIIATQYKLRAAEERTHDK